MRDVERVWHSTCHYWVMSLLGYEAFIGYERYNSRNGPGYFGITSEHICIQEGYRIQKIQEKIQIRYRKGIGRYWIYYLT